MIIKLSGMSDTANIYGIYDEAGKRHATIECILIGPHAGNYITRFTKKYTRREIWKAYKERNKTPREEANETN